MAAAFDHSSDMDDELRDHVAGRLPERDYDDPQRHSVLYHRPDPRRAAMRRQTTNTVPETSPAPVHGQPASYYTREVFGAHAYIEPHTPPQMPSPSPPGRWGGYQLPPPQPDDRRRPNSFDSYDLRPPRPPGPSDLRPSRSLDSYNPPGQYHEPPRAYADSATGYHPGPPYAPGLSGATVDPNIFKPDPYGRHPGIPSSLDSGSSRPEVQITYTDNSATKLTQYLRRRCFNCRVTEPPGWRKSTLNPGKIVCNKCGLYERSHARPRPLHMDNPKGPGPDFVHPMVVPPSASVQEGAPTFGSHTIFSSSEANDPLDQSAQRNVCITSSMRFEDIVPHLNGRGCPDLTEQIDVTSCGNYYTTCGGCGEIYKGKLRNGTPIAIKTLRPPDQSSTDVRKDHKHAAREIYTWWKLQHRNVHPLLGLALFRNQIGMVSPWENHGSIKRYLERTPDVDPCQLSVQVAEGLSYLHHEGVVSKLPKPVHFDKLTKLFKVHGDLKADNILVSEDGTPMLADFGCSTMRVYTLMFTGTTTAAGSTRWSAPEVLKEESTCGPPADVYALGM
ncbi:hypothetical protein FRC07_012241, partial [Ceratobasidium sp. 392]